MSTATTFPLQGVWLVDGAYVGREAESGKPTVAPQPLVQSCDVEGGPTWVGGPMGFTGTHEEVWTKGSSDRQGSALELYFNFTL